MRPRAGPSLPQSILEEIAAAGEKSGSRRSARPKLSRKETRKQERILKKQRKAQNSTDAKANNIKRQAETEHASSPPRKRARLSQQVVKKQEEEPARSSLPAPKPPSRRAKAISEITAPKPKSALQKLAERVGHPASLSQRSAKGKERAFAIPRTRQEKEEDAYIAYMEKKLGWSKGGSRTSKYGKGLEEDGLEDLLEGLDNIEASISDGAEVDTDEGSDSGSEDDEELGEPSKEELSERGDEDEEDDIEDDSVQWTGFQGSEEGSIMDEEDEPETAQELALDERSGMRYVPPHLRDKTSDPGRLSEAQLKLTRQLKGLLNRMSEQNLATILNGIEEIYLDHRRHDVTSTITTLILNSISSNAMLLDSYVILHAALVTSLQKIVGVEFAGYFVQIAVTQYEEHFVHSQSTEKSAGAIAEGEVIGKECSNLIMLLSELYNFQVISCTLVYDIIRSLLDGDLTELKVELLLKLTRSSGQQLRTDDPLALKEIIRLVHPKVDAQKETLSSRTRFMVETLTNLKNNKVKKSAAVTAGNNVTERLKKFLSGLNKKRHVRSHEPLRVSLEDLHSAESKGKWWLVGAAWGGDPLVDRMRQPRESAKKVDSSDTVLMKLARKQGMNTNIRRSIFVVLMSSEDYVDACERLSQLKLTEVQQREIVRVIVHCCGNEKLPNPYYAFVVQQLCRFSHSYKITLQFCLWDFLRTLGQTDVGGVEVIKSLGDDSVDFELDSISSTRMRNIARAYAWWIAKDCCALLILKPVDFAILKPQTEAFMKELFTYILINTQLSAQLLSSDPDDYPTARNRGPLEEVFIQASKVQALALGLIYYIGKTFLRDENGTKGFLTWAAKVAIDTLRTGVDIVGGL